MAVPYINNIAPFDATKQFTITFTFSGNQSYGSQIKIQDASTLTEVYNHVEGDGTNPLPLQHTVPARTLSNGKRYYAWVRSRDINGSYSDWSDKATFYCFSTPVINFKSVPSNLELSIYRDSVTISAQYSHPQGELLQKYSFVLYDSNKQVVIQSPQSYDTNNMTYTFTQLSDATVYYIKVVGETVHQMLCESDYLKVMTDYGDKDKYTTLYLNNDSCNGYITYRSNIIIINDFRDGNFKYIDQKEIDLTGEDKKYLDRVIYGNDFIIKSDFSLWLKGRDLYRDDTLLTIIDTTNDIEIVLSSHKYYDYTNNTGYFKLSVKNPRSSIEPFVYTLYSDLIDNLDTKEIIFNIRGKQGFCSMKTHERQL